MDPGPSPATIESRFELGARVAAGSFGEVLRGTERATGRAVAVKRLHPHVLDPLVLQRFDLEARLLAAVASPHVVRYVAHGYDARGLPCLVLEWLAGEDLARTLRARPLPLATAVELGVQVARGLAALHAAGAVHRDVKPANIIVLAPREGDAAGVRATLVDLGTARAAAEPRLTLEGGLVGSPLYMSPEQAAGASEIDARSDLFSLGAVLYELLAGRPPFTGATYHAVLAKVVLASPAPLEQLAPAVPPALAAVVARALAKEPAARFASADAMAEALERALDAARGSVDGAATLPPARTAASRAPDASASSRPHAAAEPRVVTGVFAAFDAAPPPPGDAGTQDALRRDQRTFAAIAAAQGGRVHPTLGGRAIAVFGQERSSGDEALRAARAALAARAELPGARLAIVTCRVEAPRATTTLAAAAAASAPTDLSDEAIERGASQLLRAVAADAVALDEATARLLTPHLDVTEPSAPGEPALLRTARGGEPAAPWSPPPRLCGRATPTVGRDREIAQLDAVLAECRDESVARVVLVTAAAGTGKSRLRHAWLARLRALDAAPAASTVEAPGVTLLAGRGDPIRAGAPFGLLAPAVRRWAAVPASGSAAVRWQALRARLAPWLARPEDATRVAEFLGELAGVPRPDHDDGGGGGAPSAQLRAARADAIVMADQVRRAWEDWLAALSSAGPVLLVLDDAHWGDAPSVRLVDAALRHLTARPLMVLALARPEVHERFASLWAAHPRTELRLAPLPPRAAERLVRAALGEHAPPETVARVVALGEGNAFVLEELARAVAEGRGVGQLAREGAEGWPAPAPADALPTTVLAIAQARLDALPERARRLARAVSVFGQGFDPGGARAVAAAAQPEPAEPAADVDAELARLVAAEVLDLRGTLREPEYVFRHELLRDAAYALLGEPARAAAHRHAGAWLEARAAAGAPTEAAVLAVHFDRGGEPARAAPYYARAAADALDGGDTAAAIARAARLEACGGLAGAPAARLAYIVSRAHNFRGEREAADRVASDGMAHVPPGSAEWFDLLSVVTSTRSGYTSPAALYAAEALGTSVAPRPDARLAALNWHFQLAVALLALGDIARAARHAEQLEVACAQWAELPLSARGRLAGLRGALGLFVHDDLEAYLHGEREGAALAEASGNIRLVCRHRLNVGDALLRLGALTEAEPHLVATLAEAQRLGIGLYTVHARPMIALARAYAAPRGAAREAARAELAAAADAAAAAQHPLWECRVRSWHAELCARDGDAAQALRAAERAVALAPVSRLYARAARASLALAHLASGDAARALREAEATVAELEAAAAHPDDGEALARLVLAEARAALEPDGDAARSFALAARDRLLARAARVRDGALRASLLANVPAHARTLALAARYAPSAAGGATGTNSSQP